LVGVVLILVPLVLTLVLVEVVLTLALPPKPPLKV
jgi:hypothetical protein